MLNITSQEAETIRKFFPGVHIRRTVNKYYMEENARAVKFLRSIQNEEKKHEQ